MKKILLLLIAIPFILTSCTKDDEPFSGDLVGRWEAVTEHDLVNGNWVLTDTYNANEYVLEFRDDGKVVEYDEGVKTYTISYSYNSQNKELTIMGIVTTVEKLTSTELVIRYLSIDNNPVTYKIIYKRI